MANDSVVILSARRTPIGAMLGAFASVPGHALGAEAMRGALESAGLDPARLGEVVMGCVLPAGQGQAPARQAAIAAGVPKSVPSTTVNKMCGSGMRAVMYGADHIAAGSADFVLAGGLESMTNAPYLLPKARAGYRMGHGEVLDHMFYDGLQSPWDGKLMGCFADATAAKYAFSRADQDAFAAESVRRAVAAVESGAFEAEIAPVRIKDRKGERSVSRDETPFTVRDRQDPEPEAGLRQGRHRHRRVLLVDRGRRGRPRARDARTPPQSGARAAGAHRRPLEPCAGAGVVHDRARRRDRVGVEARGLEGRGRGSLRDQRGVRRRDDGGHEGHRHRARKVNVHGGACALGHPIGATGARILTTLIHALKKQGKKRGLAALCIGGGEATAVAIEIS